MTSTSTFKGLENRPNSSRVLKPPGGGSSNIFGAPEEPASKPHKMASNIFGPPEEISVPKRSNPPGGKDSGIFSEPSPVPSQQSTIPAGGRSTEVFVEPAPPTAVRTHPNKPKQDANIFSAYEENEVKEQGEQESEKKEEEKPKEPTVDDHEPHLGPRPRSHNKVTQPPGGKSTLSLF
ncbi:jupiter microtubule associated homolog 2 isoform X1 [Hemitrygon akajei]|uniref:jupiter microtubule associated homolog 2 isoform X1 n=1 Tax=Hemitrygon akajei TaxID=2704970 RepID=UPI003BFA2A77